MMIINTFEDMVRVAHSAVDTVQVKKSEMLILPAQPRVLFVGNERVDERVFNLLSELSQFWPATRGDSLVPGALGLLKVASSRTVEDALSQLENSSFVDVSIMRALSDCMVQEHVKGKTRIIRMPIGDLILDLQKFAEVTGLPTESETVDYTVFPQEVDGLAFEGKRLFLIGIKGRVDTVGDSGTPGTCLEALMPRLEVRSRSIFDTAISFHTSKLQDGWALFRDDSFSKYLGWLRPNRYYTIEENEDKGGLDIDY